MFEVQVRHDDLPYRHVDVLGRADWRESVGKVYKEKEAVFISQESPAACRS